MSDDKQTGLNLPTTNIEPPFDAPPRPSSTRGKTSTSQSTLLGEEERRQMIDRLRNYGSGFVSPPVQRPPFQRARTKGSDTIFLRSSPKDNDTGSDSSSPSTSPHPDDLAAVQQKAASSRRIGGWRTPFVRSSSSGSSSSDDDARLASSSDETDEDEEFFDAVADAPAGRISSRPALSIPTESAPPLESLAPLTPLEDGTVQAAYTADAAAATSATLQKESSFPAENCVVIEKGLPRLERKLSRTISATWNAIDEHEERKANKLEHSGLQNILQRKLSQLPVRQSRLQILADGSRDSKFAVDDDYDGPKLPPPPNTPTVEHIEKLIAACRQGKMLHYRYAHELVGRVTQFHKDQGANVQRITLPPTARITIVGDLHGQLQDLLAILEFQGLPTPTNWYLFNGDFVDRGDHSVEVLWIIYAFKIMYPQHVWLNRGNHEHRLLNKRYKFERQIKNNYDERMYERVALSFDVLPLCTVLNKDVLIVHGGLTEYAELTLQDIEKIPFNREVPRDLFTKSDRVMKQLLWSDPWTQGEDPDEPTIRTHGYAQNSRGAGVLWAPVLTMRFLEKNRLRLIIRSHQMVDDGFKYHHSHHVVTLFSASYYCGKNDNRGAIAVFENGSTKSIKYIQYCADPLQAQRTAEDDAAMAAKTIKQTLQKLAEAIYHKRYKLLIGFAKMDSDCDGIISIEDWAHVLEGVIKINLKWKDLWTELFSTLNVNTEEPLSPVPDGYLRYREFLDRFSLDLDSKMLRLWNHQQEYVSSIVCSKLFTNYEDLKIAFDTLSLPHDGQFLLCANFCQILLDSELGLSRNAAADFTSTIDTNKCGTIDYQQFYKRFKKQFKLSKVPPQVSLLVRKLGDAIYAGRTNIKKKELLEKAWTGLPKNTNGEVDFSGFMLVLANLKVEADNDTKKQIFDYINISGSGSISEPEFRQAFAFRAMESSGVLRVFTLVQKYSNDLGVAFVSADSLGHGLIEEEEFVSAVMSVFEVKNLLDITEKDVALLFKAIVDESGNLNYQRAMSSFKIIFK